jgi:hypothetical protein
MALKNSPKQTRPASNKSMVIIIPRLSKKMPDTEDGQARPGKYSMAAGFVLQETATEDPTGNFNYAKMVMALPKWKAQAGAL